MTGHMQHLLLIVEFTDKRKSLSVIWFMCFYFRTIQQKHHRIYQCVNHDFLQLKCTISVTDRILFFNILIASGSCQLSEVFKS